VFGNVSAAALLIWRDQVAERIEHLVGRVDRCAFSGASPRRVRQVIDSAHVGAPPELVCCGMSADRCGSMAGR
jgi:hypothetical protein